MGKSSGLINLFMNIPEPLRNKLAEYSMNENILKGKIELVILYGENYQTVKTQIEALNGTIEDLGFGFGIITVNYSDLDKVGQIREIQYFELPKTLFTSSAGSNRASCIDTVWKLYSLTGKGILCGFVDSGIEYTNPAFIDKDGNTRIDYIYDLSAGGKEYNSADINKALKSTDPLSIVPETDEIGHGTFVTGVAAAGGKVDEVYYGPAYESRIAMVKMTNPGKVNYAKSTQLMRGVKALVKKSDELQMPLVINLSFGTNDGAHEGTSLLEQYISIISNLTRICFIVATGNEADSGRHVGSILKEQQSVTVNIGQETGLTLQFYKSLLDDISIEFRSSSGVSSGVIYIKPGFVQKNMGDNELLVYYTGAKPFSMTGEIVVSILPMKDYITPGPWVIRIYDSNPSGRRYDIWLPISEGLSGETRFLEPNPYFTLTIPSTVSNVISVGSYNYVTDQISSFSGRGRDVPESEFPNLVAPGENITSVSVNNSIDTESGTSVAAPMVSGACALLMQWGILEGNNLFMYGKTVTNLLLRGARRNRMGVVYPDPEWGYGELCLRRVFELLNGSGTETRNSLCIRQQKNCGEIYTASDTSNYIVEYQGDIVSKYKDSQDACVFILDENYAVISVRNSIAQQVKKVKEIVYIQDRVLYTLNSLSPIEVANIDKFHDNPYLTLTGQGTLVGIVDTGIDYLNPEFMYEDDTTRIVTMWDQNVEGGNVPKDFSFGSEYTRDQINQAIQLKSQNKDPYSVVPEQDTIGHGTAVAGIVGARGRKGDVIGAAPGCEFVIVKLKRARESIINEIGMNIGDIPIYENTDLILGIKYLYNVARSLGKPIVIHIGLGTNAGAHDGTSILERYIDSIAKVRGIAVVTGTGDQGDAAIHAEGLIPKTGDMKNLEVKIGENQGNIIFWIWAHKPDKISIGVVSPSGQVVERIPAKLQGTDQVDFVFEGSTLHVEYFVPEDITGDELIKIRIDNVKSGIWNFKLYGDNIVDGRYDAYLPQRSILKPETRFIAPTPYGTLTIPSTSRLIITSAFYNQDNNSVVSASGRGYTRDGMIKPDIAAGGVNVLTTKGNDGTTTVTGSSAASAVTAGAVSLLLEWGIVDGNDPTMYSTKIKTYLIRGAYKRPGDVYPNRELGYGLLDLNGVFENMRSVSKEKSGIFIRIPYEIKRILNI